MNSIVLLRHLNTKNINNSLKEKLTTIFSELAGIFVMFSLTAAIIFSIGLQWAN